MIQTASEGKAVLTMTGGSLSSAVSANFRIGANVGYDGVFNLSGGTVNVGGSMAVGPDIGGTGILNMSGGEVNIGWALTVPQVGGVGRINLYNGTIDTHILEANTNGIINITEGILKIDGDVRSTINDYITESKLIAYSGTGSLLVSYDSGQTIITAEPTLDILINFEAAEPNSNYTRNATYTSITTNPAEIVKGSKSLKMNTMSSGGGWFELFSTTTSGVSLDGGKRYAVSFYYKVLDLDLASGSFFWCRVASSSTGGVQGDFPFREEFGANYHEKKIILPAGVNDYQVSLGITNKGSVIIDNVRIEELEDINVAADGMVVADSDYEPYGMCAHFTRPEAWAGSGYTDAEVITSIEMLADAGVQWIRGGASWQTVEGTQGAINYIHLMRVDLALNTAISHGMKTYFQIGFPPQWAVEEPTEPDWWAYGPKDEYMDEWGDNVTFLANRYKGKVTYWGVGNEIDWTFWKSSLEKYVTFLAIAHNKLKEVDPNNQVIIGGLAFEGEHVWQLRDGAEEHALQKLYDAGAKDYFDIFAMHPYTYDVNDGTVESIDDLNNAWRIMKLNGDGDKPIWITELGISMNGDSTSQNAGQAQYLENLYTELIKHPKVEKIFWYNFRAMTGVSDQENNFGIVNRDLTIKPAYTTLYNLPKAAVRKVNYDYIPDKLLVDLDGNQIIDHSDLAIMSLNWLASDSSFPNWSGGADLNHDGSVNFLDLTILAERWAENYLP